MLPTAYRKALLSGWMVPVPAALCPFFRKMIQNHGYEVDICRKNPKIAQLAEENGGKPPHKRKIKVKTRNFVMKIFVSHQTAWRTAMFNRRSNKLKTRPNNVVNYRLKHE